MRGDGRGRGGQETGLGGFVQRGLALKEKPRSVLWLWLRTLITVVLLCLTGYLAAPIAGEVQARTAGLAGDPTALGPWVHGKTEVNPDWARLRSPTRPRNACVAASRTAKSP